MIPKPVPLDRLVRIVRRLRGPGGCPWDRRQTHASIKPYLVEESYEVLDAIDRKDSKALKEELGDLLLQVVLHSAMEEEKGRFRMDDVVRGLTEKIIRRHPHVFANGRRPGARNRRVTAKGALKQWEIMKNSERRGPSSVHSVPRGLPALLRASRIQEKAARLGFEWTRFSQALAKAGEEMRELKGAIRGGNRTRIRAELGDVFFALAKVGRLKNIDAEDALQAATGRFVRRFARLEREVARSGRPMHEVRPRELYAAWNRQNPSRRGGARRCPARTGRTRRKPKRP